LTGDEEASAGGRALLAASGVGTEDETDVMNGSAGTLLAHLNWPGAADGWVTRRLAESLLTDGGERPGVPSWAQPGSGAHLIGLAHGTGGIGLSLAEAGAALDDPRLVECSRHAISYGRSLRSVDGAWPDLRPRTRGGGPGPSWRVTWCHGTAGVTLTRVRAWSLLRDPVLLREAREGLDIVARALARDTPPGGGDVCLCHGSFGLADVLLTGARTLPATRPEWLSGVEKAGEEAWRSVPARGLPWPCGPTGEIPGLMTGVAGIAHFMLRLSDPSVPSVLWTAPPGVADEGRPMRAREPEVTHVH